MANPCYPIHLDKFNPIQFFSLKITLSGSHVSEDYTDTISWHSGGGGGGANSLLCLVCITDFFLSDKLLSSKLGKF